MAPKQVQEMKKNLSLASSSEKEEDSGSEENSGEESDSPEEESKKEESYVSKKHVANSEAEPSAKKKPQNTLVNKAMQEISVASPSEDEDEEEQGEGEEESNSSGEDSKKEESKLTQTNVAPLSSKKHEANKKKKNKMQNILVTKPRPESSQTKEESECSGEDSKKKEAKKSNHMNVAPLASKRLEAESKKKKNKKKKKQNFVVTKPMHESSKPKRYLEEAKDDVKLKKKKKPSTEEEVKKKRKKVKTLTIEDQVETEKDAKKKKLKTQTTEEHETKDEEVKKTPLFQRLFSEEDDIALLQGILDFTSTRGDPYENMDGFYESAKKLISFNASKSQLVTKVQRLKTKFGTTLRRILRKGKSEEDPIVFPKASEKKTFELSRMIWGNNGVLASKLRKKLGGNIKEEAKEQETNVASSSEKIASFLKEENMLSSGLDESTVIVGWDKVEDGPKKSEIVEDLKKMKEKQRKLCFEKIELVAYVAKEIGREYASTSSN